MRMRMAYDVSGVVMWMFYFCLVVAASGVWLFC